MLANTSKADRSWTAASIGYPVTISSSKLQHSVAAPVVLCKYCGNNCNSHRSLAAGCPCQGTQRPSAWHGMASSWKWVTPTQQQGSTAMPLKDLCESIKKLNFPSIPWIRTSKGLPPSSAYLACGTAHHLAAIAGQQHVNRQLAATNGKELQAEG